MAPSEGDRSNRFAEFNRNPDRMTDTGSSDESDCTTAKKVITKDTSRDVSSSTSAAPPHASSNNTSNLTNQPAISPARKDPKTSSRLKTPPRKNPPSAKSETAENWGSDSTDSDGTSNGKLAAITKPKSKTTITINEPPLTTTPNTPYSVSPRVHHTYLNQNSTPTSNVNNDNWDGTIVNGKKTPKKSNLSTPTRRQETSPSKNVAISNDNATKGPDDKTPSICGSYGSLRDLREGAVKYERLLHNDEPYNPINEAKGLFQAIMESDPTAFFVSMKDPELKITDPTQVPVNPKDLEAFFESSMTRSKANTKYIFSFKIRTQLSLYALKESNNRSLLDYLKRFHSSLTEHRFESLVTEKIGWFSMKTTNLSLEGFREALCYEFLELTNAKKNIDTMEAQIPPFEVVVARVSETADDEGPSEGVLAISCQEADSEVVRKLFSNQSLDADRYGAFVLFSTRRSNPAMHNNMVSRHRKFLRSTIVLQTSGLSWGLLCSTVTDPRDNQQKMLLDTIINSSSDITSIDESKYDNDGLTQFCFTVPRESKAALKNYIYQQLPTLAASSTEYEGQEFILLERERTATSVNAEKLAEMFPPIDTTPPRKLQQRRQHQVRETSSFQWANTQQYPLLPQASSASPPAIRTYRQVAGTPQSKHNPLAGFPSLNRTSSKQNKNTRNYQTLTTLNQVPAAPKPTDATKPQSQVTLNSSFDIDIDTITMGGTLADESIAASIQSVLTEFSKKLQRSEEVILLQETFVRDAATALQAQKSQSEELKTQVLNAEKRAETQTLKAEKRAETAEKSLKEQTDTIKSSIETLLDRDRRRDNELTETKSHLGELQATVSEKIDNQRNTFQYSQDKLVEQLLSAQRAQTEALLLALVPMQQSIASLQEKEQASPESSAAPTTPSLHNPVSSVHVASTTSMSTLTCPTSGRTTSIPDTQPLLAISENEPHPELNPTSHSTCSTSSLPLAALGKRMTVATPTIRAPTSTPSPILPLKRHKPRIQDSSQPNTNSPNVAPPSPAQLSETHTPDTLFDTDASALATATHIEEQCQHQLSDPKLAINNPDLLSFLQHVDDTDEQKTQDWITSKAHASPDINADSLEPLTSSSGASIDNLSAITNPMSSDPPRKGRQIKSPTTLNSLTKTLFSTSSHTSNSTTTTASATTASTPSSTSQEAPARAITSGSPRQKN